MNKFRNKGVSFFELVIAVAIFAILVIPITSQLIQALKTSDSSSKAQTKYEFAENLMENIKNVNMDSFLSDGITADEYITKVSDSGSVKRYPDKNMYTGTVTNGGNTAEYNGCILTGETEIGTGSKAEKYYYAVLADNKAYAEKSIDGSNYSNPNDSTLALIESLDSSKVALINGTIGNYDSTVTNAFMSKKLDLLKIGDRTRWEQYTKQQADIVAFPNDTVKRVIEISVSSERAPTYATDGMMNYTVTCKLRYKDQSGVVLKEGPYAGSTLGSLLSEIDYTPYTQTFEATELPSIYLMYNPCLYNNNYMENDYIILDTSGMERQMVDVLDENGKVVYENNVPKQENGYPQVNLFIVETAEKFSEQAAKSYALVTVAQKAVEDNLSAIAKAKATAAANAVGDPKSDEWQVTYDKTYDAEYKKAKEESYDTEYATAYKSVTDAVNKNDSSSTWKQAYDAAYTEYKNKNLISTSTIRSRSRSKVNIIGKKPTGVADTKKYVHIYHNFTEDGYSDSDKRTTLSNVFFGNADPINGNGRNMYTLDASQFKPLTEAITTASPLYNVSVYLSKEPFVSGSSASYTSLYNKLTGEKATISGTKGGN